MQHIEDIILKAIDDNKEQIIAFAKSINGEAGFYEHDTAEKFEKAFVKLGLPVKGGLARTGVRATLKFSDGIKIAAIGELDGINCPSHPLANSKNGIAHACGHSAQLAAVFGAAIGLTQTKAFSKLSGSAVFFAVPAEEFIPLNNELLSNGITQCAGKPELIKRGDFDDISLSLVTHAHMLGYNKPLALGLNCACGFVGKEATFIGKASHAAAAPFDGINALNAAALSLNAIGLLRETFKEEDCIRIHTNITQGGTALNVVPDKIVVKAMIRGKTNQAIKAASEKYETALINCAKALGAICEIKTIDGYIPVPYLEPFSAAIKAAEAIGVEFSTADDRINFASTDVGFLNEIMPVCAFTHGGFEGALHSADFKAIDDESAYILPAKMMALEIYYLLKNNAELACKEINNK